MVYRVENSSVGSLHANTIIDSSEQADIAMYVDQQNLFTLPHIYVPPICLTESLLCPSHCRRKSG